MKKLLLSLMVAITLVCGARAYSLDYPTRPVELVLPFGEGSATDIFARKFSEIMNKSMAHPIFAVNKAGGGGLVGMVYAAKQRPDGYSILSITPSHIISDVLVRAGKITLPGDFEPLARIQSDIYVLCSTKGSSFSTFKELVDHARNTEVTFAGISPGGLDDLTLNALAFATGMKIKFVPYKSGAEVKAGVLGGEVEIYLDKIVSASGYIKDGSVKPLVVLNKERLSSIPEFADVPTTVESGFDVTIGSWRGFVVRKGTPKEIKDYLIDVMKKAYDDQSYKDFAKMTFTDVGPGWLEGDDFTKFLESEYKVFDDVSKKIGLKK